MATHRQLMTVLSKLGITNDQRHDLVYNWTNGRTESTKNLTQDELDKMVEVMHKNEPVPERVPAILSEATKRRRSLVLKLATDSGIKRLDGWSEFNSFMLNTSKFKKSLNKHSDKELDELTKQFRGILANNEKYPKKPDGLTVNDPAIT